jgi:hypothetical protein
MQPHTVQTEQKFLTWSLIREHRWYEQYSYRTTEFVVVWVVIGGFVVVWVVIGRFVVVWVVIGGPAVAEKGKCAHCTQGPPKLRLHVKREPL